MKGQTIIEVVVALGAGAIVLTAMTVIILTSLKNSQQSSSQSLATQYAQQGMDIARQMKDNNWTAFNSLNGNYCVASSCSEISLQGTTCGPKGASCSANIDNKFVREVTISAGSTSCRPQNYNPSTTYSKITTIVSWRDPQCTSVSNPYCHNVSLQSCVSNYNKRPAP